MTDSNNNTTPRTETTGPLLHAEEASNAEGHEVAAWVTGLTAKLAQAVPARNLMTSVPETQTELVEVVIPSVMVWGNRTFLHQWLDEHGFDTNERWSVEKCRPGYYRFSQRRERQPAEAESPITS